MTLPAIVNGKQTDITREQVQSWQVFSANCVEGKLQDGSEFRCWVDHTRWERFVKGTLE